MKRVLMITLLVFTMLACTACGGNQTSSVPAAATADEAATTREPKKVVATRPSEGETTAAQPTTEESTAAETTEGTTAPATTRPDPNKIPADNITSGNINPNLGSIQNRVISELSNREMTELSLDRGNVTMLRGETVEVGIDIKPTDCSNKRLDVQVDNACVKATVNGTKLTIVAEQAGETYITLTAENGLLVRLAVEVKEKETEPVVTEAEPTPAPTPAEEATAE
ncbi:MAG: hypothetical protein II614_06415 [Ruminococcus sp.]|nr:hypothetical protein [Ruminococcus sp.]MBQ4171229.1 hypothetical protein [Ruminococcus sp.]SCX03975.1 hypothetical protein SAMN02910436_00294 [Ruminococcaceae bacterium P7]